MWFFVIFVGWPLLEIALFVTVGGWLGLWPTLAAVLGSGLLGVAILRGLGLQSAAQLRQSVLGPHSVEVLAGTRVVTLLAAVLLILPGFLTDTVGVLLLVPPLQRLLVQWVMVRMLATVRSRFGTGFVRQGQSGQPVSDAVIEVDFQEVDPAKRPTHPPSGWRSH